MTGIDLGIFIDGACKIPVRRQIADAIRKKVIANQLPLGTALPSVRELASHLKVSLSTVQKAYEDLSSQGYIETIVGTGTRICARLPGNLDDLGLIERQPIPLDPEVLSQWARRLITTGGQEVGVKSQQGQMAAGVPPSTATPTKKWRELLEHQCRTFNTSKLKFFEQPLGYPPLREAYADFLVKSRAAKCTADNVIVFSARELRLDLLCRLLLQPGDKVAVEEPGYPSAKWRFANHGAVIDPIPVDHEGMDVGCLANSRAPVKIVYVTPSHQEPTGVVLSPERRGRLLEWASRTGALIVEDDFDAEFNFDSKRLPCLQGQDQDGSVVHLSCFWRILSPVCKLGFLVVPDALMPAMERAKFMQERHLSLLDQFVLTDFISQGHLDRHLRKVRQVCHQRRDALSASVQKHFGQRAEISRQSGGMEILIRIQTDKSDAEVTAAFLAGGMRIFSSSAYYLTTNKTGEFVIPFAPYDGSTIERAVGHASLTI